MSAAGGTELVSVKPADDMLQMTAVGTALTRDVDALYWQVTIPTHTHTHIF